MKRREFLGRMGSYMGIGALLFAINGCGTMTADMPEADPMPDTLFYYDIDGYKKELTKNIVVSPNIQKLRIYMISRASNVKVLNSNNDLVQTEVKWLSGAKGQVAAEVYFKDNLKYGESYTLKYMGSDDTFVMSGNVTQSNPIFKATFKVTPLELDKNIVTLKVGEEKTIKALKLHINGEEYNSIKIESVKDSGFKYYDSKAKNINGKVSTVIKNGNEIIIKGEQKGELLLTITAKSEDVNSTEAEANVFVKVQ